MTAESFQFRRDFKRVQWLPTLQVTLFRCIAAGVIVGLVMLIGSVLDKRSKVEWSGLAAPLIWPAVYLMFLLPIGVACTLASSLDNIVGTIASFFSLVMAIFASIGDPLVYFLHRAKPWWVPIERYPFFGFTLILWVLRPEGAASGTAPEPADCRTPLPASGTAPGEEAAKTVLAQQKYEQAVSLQESCRTGSDSHRFTEEESERLVRAAKLMGEVVQLDPKHIEAHISLARTFHVLGNYDPAIACGETAFDLAPNNRRARNVLSASHFEKGKQRWDAHEWREAFRSFRRSFEVDPYEEQGGRTAFAMMIHCAYEAGDSAALHQFLQGWLQTHPEDGFVREAIEHLRTKS